MFSEHLEELLWSIPFDGVFQFGNPSTTTWDCFECQRKTIIEVYNDANLTPEQIISSIQDEYQLNDIHVQVILNAKVSKNENIKEYPMLKINNFMKKDSIFYLATFIFNEENLRKKDQENE